MNLYQEIILEHAKRPHHAGLREPFDAQVHHINPTCGDEITLRVQLVGAGGVDVVHLSIERLTQAGVMRPFRVLKDDLLIEAHQIATPNTAGTRSRAASNAST